MHTSFARICIPLFLFSFAATGCSGPDNVTYHGELPAGSVIEVTFDQPGSSLLALEISGSRIISEGGSTSRGADTRYGFQQVNTGVTWTHELDDDRNGVAASFRSHSDIPFTVQLKSGGKVLKELKSGDTKEVMLLAGIVGNETTVDARNMRPDAKQSEYLAKLLEDWLVGNDLRSYVVESFTEDEITRLVERGTAIQTAYSPDIPVAVKRIAAWKPESEEDGVTNFWGVLVREDGEELLVEFLRNENGKLKKFAFDGPLYDKLSIDE